MRPLLVAVTAVAVFSAPAFAQRGRPPSGAQPPAAKPPAWTKPPAGAKPPTPPPDGTKPVPPKKKPRHGGG